MKFIVPSASNLTEQQIVNEQLNVTTQLKIASGNIEIRTMTGFLSFIKLHVQGSHSTLQQEKLGFLMSCSWPGKDLEIKKV